MGRELEDNGARVCSRFLITLAQFHSNRSRLIHGVQFNPFSRTRSATRKEGPMEKGSVVIAGVSLAYPSSIQLPHRPRVYGEVSIRRSIIHILNCQSLLDGDCHSVLAARIRQKGSG